MLAALATAPALGATVLKVDKGRDQAILKVSPAEAKELKAGNPLTFDAGGESVEAEVVGVSGKGAKLKILYGIDSLSAGQTVDLKSKEKEKKDPPTEHVEAKERKRAPASPADDASGAREGTFVLGAGGKSSPFSNDLEAPWSLNSPNASNVLAGHSVFALVNPAQMTHVEKYAVVAGFEAIDGKYSDKASGRKTTFDLSSQYFGFTGIVNIQAGVRLGLTYGQDEDDDKTKFSATGVATDTSKTKRKRDQITLLIAVPINDRVALGAELSQVSVKDKTQGQDSRSTSYQILRPGITYATRQYEIGLKYSPPIDIEETDGSTADPRRWVLHGQYHLNDVTSVGGTVEHLRASGIDDDSTDFVMTKLGATWRTASGSWGLFGLYDSKFYLKANNASPLDIPQLGVQALASFSMNKQSAVDTGVTIGRGEAKLKTGANDKTSTLSAQAIDLFATYRYVL